MSTLSSAARSALGCFVVIAAGIAGCQERLPEPLPSEPEGRMPIFRLGASQRAEAQSPAAETTETLDDEETNSSSSPIMLQFDFASDFADGIALVRIADRLAYIDASGNLAIAVDPTVEEASAFSEELAIAKVGLGYGYINRTGEFAIAPQYQQASPFSEGLAAVKLQKYGYIDTSGNMVISPQFDLAANFSEGLAAVKRGSSYGYIDKSGRLTVLPELTDAWNSMMAYSSSQKAWVGYGKGHSGALLTPMGLW